MPKEAQEIQFALPGAPTLLELCQRLVSAKRGISDPLPGAEFEASLQALRKASAHWSDNDDPFDAGVLAMVRTTILLISPLPRERAEMYSAVLDAVSEHRDALIGCVSSLACGNVP